MEIVSTESLLDGMVRRMLGRSPRARVGIIGPSTLDRDHSVLYWSDILAGSSARLIVVDRPPGPARYTFSSLKMLQLQMAELHRQYPQLHVPEYVECDAFKLSERMGEGDLDLIYDHNSLVHIVGERPQHQGMAEATYHVLREYNNVLSSEGTIILMMPYRLFFGDARDPNGRTYWQEMVLSSLERNGLECELFLLEKDIDKRDKFPELRILAKDKGPQYPCCTLAVARKG